MRLNHQSYRRALANNFRYDGPAHIVAAAVDGDNRYEPDGGYSPAAPFGLPLTAALLFAVPAWFYVGFGAGNSPLMNGGLCFGLLIIWGLLAGLAAVALVKVFKVRDPLLAVLLAVGGGLAAWLATFPMVYLVAGDQSGFLTFYFDRLKNGVVVDLIYRSEAPVYKLVKGFGLVVLWLCEGAGFCLLAALGAGFQASRPFSTRRNRWYTRVPLPSRRPDDGELYILASLSANMIITYLTQQAGDYPRLSPPAILRSHSFHLNLYLEPDESWQYLAVSTRLSIANIKVLRYLRIDNHTATVLLEKFGRAPVTS